MRYGIHIRLSPPLFPHGLEASITLFWQISADWKLIPESQKASLTSGYLASRARWQKEMAAVPPEDKEAALREKRAKKAVKLGRSATNELRSEQCLYVETIQSKSN